jgi:hypothetical protein
MHNIWLLVSKPDNIPIVALLFAVLGYTWWSFYRALKNDRQGFLDEERLSDKIQVWPNLVRVEFLASLFIMVILVFWSFGIDAPLEEPANPTLTPNPSKAPCRRCSCTSTPGSPGSCCRPSSSWVSWRFRTST